MSPRTRRKKTRKKGRGKGCALVLLVLLLLAGGALFAAYSWAHSTLTTPFKGYAGEEKLVRIESGTGVRQILDRLEQEGVLAHSDLARLYLVRVLGDPPVQAGEYRFSEPLDTRQVLGKLIRGDVVTYSVTLVEGLTLMEQAEQLAREGFGEEAAFLEAMGSPSLIADLDPRATDLEGYLFPDTYRFARGASEADIVSTLVATFRKNLQEHLRPLLGADAPGRLREVVTLASIVEKEARLDEERPVIAGVYANRLERGIALYADPTVIYALKRLGRWDGNLRRPDLQLDSPFNTYRYPGLPPGPIASPGLSSLKAAAQPADVPYLYFVSRNDGSHVFAETLAEHNRNVAEWQKRYWQKRWAQQAR